jgi:uncharacterized protein (TIGR00369 family)
MDGMRQDVGFKKVTLDDLNKRMKEVPLWKMVDMDITFLDWGRSEMKMQVKDTYLNVMGSCHGGIIATFADTVMGAALYSMAVATATIEMNINYLEPITAGQELTGRGEVLRKGRTNAVIRADLFVEGTMVATARGTYGVFEADNEK